MKGDSWVAETQVCLKMRSFFNFASKGSSGALILGKQLTYKSEWAHKRSWEIFQHNSNNSEKQSRENDAFLQTHIKNAIYVKTNVCCTIRGVLKTIFRNTNISSTLL